jgi:tungstate transport system substrate-binding protein
MKHRLIYCLVISAALWVSAAAGEAAERFIVVASTPSTQNSGLYEYMLPIFTKQTGIQVRVVAVGTGHAIKIASNCDADVLFVHAKPAELKFVASGYGVKRYDVMYNDFVIVGPKSDPAAVKGMTNVVAALQKIAAGKQPFASRGDDSGTNKKELALWKTAGIDPSKASGTWYRETGSGMGATLNTAKGMNAYTLTDRATWLFFKNKGDLVIEVQGDPKLFNQYGIMRVNPEKCPHVKVADGQKFVDWVLSPEGQHVIKGYKIKGQQAFFPNAEATVSKAGG